MAHRRALAAERQRESFWALPAVLVICGVVLAVLTVQARLLGLPRSWLAGVPVSTGEAAGLLGIVASATLTFLGVVFTLTLVALQLASSQLSPRVLRTFVRSGVTKLAFGLLLATFAFSVAFLILEGGRHEADSRGVTAAMILVAASVAVFVVFVARIMRLLQVAWVITTVAGETRAAVLRCYPPAGGYQQAELPEAPGPSITIRLPAGHWGRNGTLGVVQAVDRARMCTLASRHGCVLQLLVRVGEYVPAGSAVVAAHGSAPPAGEVLRAISLGRVRTLYQDPAFGLRQLVDIAIQALSPAVNQPTTAVQVIDRLEDILLHIAAVPDRAGRYADQAGLVRFVEPVMSWDDHLDLAFTEITDYGRSSVQVVRRLAAAYDALAAAVGAERRAPLRARRTALLDQASRLCLAPGRLEPDPMGLG